MTCERCAINGAFLKSSLEREARLQSLMSKTNFELAAMSKAHSECDALRVKLAEAEARARESVNQFSEVIRRHQEQSLLNKIPDPEVYALRQRVELLERVREAAKRHHVHETVGCELCAALAAAEPATQEGEA